MEKLMASAQKPDCIRSWSAKVPPPRSEVIAATRVKANVQRASDAFTAVRGGHPRRVAMVRGFLCEGLGPAWIIGAGEMPALTLGARLAGERSGEGLPALAIA
jgi:hypothetical protein